MCTSLVQMGVKNGVLHVFVLCKFVCPPITHVVWSDLKVRLELCFCWPAVLCVCLCVLGY